MYLSASILSNLLTKSQNLNMDSTDQTSRVNKHTEAREHNQVPINASFNDPMDFDPEIPVSYHHPYETKYLKRTTASRYTKYAIHKPSSQFDTQK